MSEGFTIINPNPNRVALIAAKHGLRAIKKGFRLNHAYTPQACRKVIERETGLTFKPRDYDGMIAAADQALKETERC